MKHILLVDDDDELTAMLSEYLQQDGFYVHTVNNGETGAQEALKGQYQIIVMDVMMPRLSGIEALRRIREESNVPVIMLTARGDNIDTITGLNLGADDYIAKPCTPGELSARIRAVLRRGEAKSLSSEDEALTVGKLTLFPNSRKVQLSDQQIELTGAEFSILEVLMQNAGKLVSKQDLSKRAFGQNLGSYDRRIDVHISSIRQKLSSAENGASWIQTVRGSGYQLVKE